MYPNVGKTAGEGDQPPGYLLNDGVSTAALDLLERYRCVAGWVTEMERGQHRHVYEQKQCRLNAV